MAADSTAVRDRHVTADTTRPAPVPVSPSTTAAPAPDPPGRRRQHRFRWSVGALLLTLVPVVVAAVRAIRDGWVPVGDDANVSIRAHDVLGGGALPLIGTWSGKSWFVGFNVHHPGPLFFDVLAVPAALVPGPAGLVVGTAVVNMAAIVGIFLVARRRGGDALALTAMAVTAALGWSMGSGVLAEPWNVGALLLPFLCYCLLAWSVTCGDLPCLPWMAFLGSLLLQANLAYVVLVGGMAVLALAAASWRRGGGDVGPGRRHLGSLSLLVLVVCWARPLYEQLFGPGYGNMTRIARSTLEPSPTMGFTAAIEAVAKIVALPPWWGRPSYAEAFPFTAFGNPLPALVPAVGALAAVGWLLVAGLRRGRRSGDRTGVALAATALALLAFALVTAKATPVNEAYGTTAYQLRWLWPAGAFVAFALLAPVVRAMSTGMTAAAASAGGAASASADRSGRLATGLLVGTTVVFAVLTLPASDQGTTAPSATVRIAQGIVHDVADADLAGPLLVDCMEGVFDPYCEAVMAELQRRDVDFVLRDPIALQQVGEERTWHDTNRAVAKLTVATGDRTLWPGPGARTIARHDALSRAEQRELVFLREDLATAASQERLRLNERGVRVARRGDLPSATLHGDQASIDVGRLVAVRTRLFGEHRRDLVAMARDDLLDVDPGLTSDLERYADLQTRWDAQTVAVFLEPLLARS